MDRALQPHTLVGALRKPARAPRGEPFGPYLLLSQVGSGGMAEVFLAASRGSGGFVKLLCIKRVRPELAHDEELVQLLVDEAKIVSRITHPHVAQVFDLGVIEGQYYIAMEYVDGVDAFAVLQAAGEREVALPPAAAALVVRDLCEGLAAAHRLTDDAGQPLGVIHRDVTPHNVLVSYEGQVKLIDFGVAKATLRAAHTQAGVIKGKYNYLSPEQARAGVLDARTDVFSAGIVLWELLAGEPLYPGDNVAELLDVVRRAKIPSIRRRRREVGKPLAKIVERALARDRKDRFSDASEMATALTHYLGVHEPGYHRTDLAELVKWLFPRAGGDQRALMTRLEYQSSPEVSIVSAPGIALIDRVPAAPREDEGIADAVTRIVDRLSAASTDAPIDHLSRSQTRRIRSSESGATSSSTTPPAPWHRPLAAPPASSPPPRTNSPPARASTPPPLESTEPTRLAPERGRPLLFAVAALLALTLLSIVGALAVRTMSEPDPTLLVESVPAGAEIWLDGQPTGFRTPARLDDELRPGAIHELRLTRSGYETWSRSATIGGGPMHILAALRRPPRMRSSAGEGPGQR